MNEGQCFFANSKWNIYLVFFIEKKIVIAL